MRTHFSFHEKLVPSMYLREMLLFIPFSDQGLVRKSQTLVQMGLKIRFEKHDKNDAKKGPKEKVRQNKGRR